MLLMVRGALPVFDSVTVLGALVVFTFCFPNLDTGGDGLVVCATPVPDTPEVWGLLLALSVTVNVALRDPVAVGVNVTLIVQFPPAARLDPQVLVCPKSPGLAPVKAMLVTLNAVVVGLERVTA